jgi:hypothetical protein
MDRPLELFLRAQADEAARLAKSSELLDVVPLDGTPPHRYLVDFRVKGFVRKPSGEIGPWERFVVGVHFAPDYLQRADTFHVLSWIHPPHAYYPNVSNGSAFICIGNLVPGTGLTELVRRLWQLITYRHYSLSECDSLNPAARQWALRNRHLFPTDPRPLGFEQPAGSTPENTARKK